MTEKNDGEWQAPLPAGKITYFRVSEVKKKE